MSVYSGPTRRDPFLLCLGAAGTCERLCVRDRAPGTRFRAIAGPARAPYWPATTGCRSGQGTPRVSRLSRVWPPPTPMGRRTGVHSGQAGLSTRSMGALALSPVQSPHTPHANSVSRASRDCIGRLCFLGPWQWPASPPRWGFSRLNWSMAAPPPSLSPGLQSPGSGRDPEITRGELCPLQTRRSLRPSGPLSPRVRAKLTGSWPARPRAS